MIYVTPERLAKSKQLMNRLEKAHELGQLRLLAVHEVHCCSQWGHDFRPDYKLLGVLRSQFPGVPMLGVTATATERVIRDVMSMLNICNLIQWSNSGVESMRSGKDEPSSPLR